MPKPSDVVPNNCANIHLAKMVDSH
jgi:hypothetical protein